MSSVSDHITQLISNFYMFHDPTQQIVIRGLFTSIQSFKGKTLIKNNNIKTSWNLERSSTSCILLFKNEKMGPSRTLEQMYLREIEFKNYHF